MASNYCSGIVGQLLSLGGCLAAFYVSPTMYLVPENTKCWDGCMGGGKVM